MALLKQTLNYQHLVVLTPRYSPTSSIAQYCPHTKGSTMLPEISGTVALFSGLFNFCLFLLLRLLLLCLRLYIHTYLWEHKVEALT